MSAEVAANWQKEQSNRVTTYKPKKPEIPNDYRCPKGDDACTAKTPPGSINEAFRSSTQYPTTWIALMAVTSIAFFLITRSR